MPRPTIVIAGGVIAFAALTGLALGMMRDLKSRGGPDLDSGEVVAPIKTVANASPLTAPPVTEADVRRWVREELQARSAAAASKSPKPESDTGLDDLNTRPDSAAVPAPAAPSVPSSKTPAAPQIPF
jgi:hypothetical protein